MAGRTTPGSRKETQMKYGWQTLLALAVALPSFAQTGGDPRGIFLDRGDETSSAIRFSVLLDRDGVRKVVPATYTFQSGDRMKFQFELNHGRYIYILLHSVAADPANLDRYAGTRGIEVIRDEDQRAPAIDSWKLLFPTQEAGTNNLVSARAVKAIPSAGTAYFRMDKKPGMEKLLVVVSPTPLDFGAYFDTRTGKLRNGAEDVVGRLSRCLIDYGGNSRLSSSGIEVDAYAAASSASKPMLVPVDLRHAAAK
jgi:hypothetical protein